MSINYCERLKYRLREILIKIKRVNDWIKDNPSEKNANMGEITNYLYEVGWILNDLKNHIISTKTNYMTSEISELIEEMKFMLKERNDSIRTFTDAVGITDLWNDFVSNVFSGNINFYSTFENLKIKKLVCKEIGVLKYIYEVRRKNFNYLYENESEFEYMRNLLEQTTHCPEIGKKLIELIEGYYYNEPLKGSNDIFEVQSEKILPVEGGNLADNKNKALNNKLKSKEEIYYFDDIVFSSPEEELEFAEESTKKFSIWDCFINHKRSNATIFLDSNNEFCLHPIKTHLFSVMKLYRALHNLDIDMSTDESALDFNNNQGNVIFRIVNGSSVKYFVPYFPTNINEFQLEKLKQYYQEFLVVYSYLTANNVLDEKHKSLFEEGLEALEQYINKYDSMHHIMK